MKRSAIIILSLLSVKVSIPEKIGDLSELKELHLQFNQLTTLPRNLGLLENLKILNINKKDRRFT